MFESIMALWPMLQSAISNPNTAQAATQMSALGDPDAVMPPLFADAQQWSPTHMGGATDSQQMQGAMMQRPQGPMQGFADMLGGMPGIPNGQSAGALAQGIPPTAPVAPAGPVPMPPAMGTPMPVPVEDRGTQASQQDADRARLMDRRNQLTQQQYKELMGMMPDQKGYVPPAPGVIAPRGLSGNMQMLEAGQRQMPRRATLGDLIYGGR